MSPDRLALHGMAEITAEIRDKYLALAETSPDPLKGILRDFASICADFNGLAESCIAINEAAEQERVN